MTRPVVISRAHRDALYAELLLALSEVPDLEPLINSRRPEDIEECQRIGQRLSEVFRLIQDGGLGWGYPDGNGVVEVTLPPSELRQIMESQRRLLVLHQQANQADREETEQEWRQAEEARAACTAVLEQIEEVAAPCR